jgi:hypothetical protein
VENYYVELQKDRLSRFYLWKDCKYTNLYGLVEWKVVLHVDSMDLSLVLGIEPSNGNFVSKVKFKSSFNTLKEANT